MWSRPALFLWISIRISGNKKFRLTLPIALYPLLMLADIIEDVSYFSRFFGRKDREKAAGMIREMANHGFNWEALKNPTPDMLHSAAKMLHLMLVEIMFQCGAMDLVDVDVQNNDINEHVRVHISIK